MGLEQVHGEYAERQEALKTLKPRKKSDRALVAIALELNGIHNALADIASELLLTNDMLSKLLSTRITIHTGDPETK